MQRIATIADLRARLEGHRAGGGSVGFVPTMGYLHEGHASLIDASVAGNDLTVVSVFVNPLQFAAGEDLASYPRDLERDSTLCDEHGADVLFCPSVEEMYPRPVLTTVSVGEVSTRFEGAVRPTHFAGVATVVAKLFSIVGTCRAYFGEKDYQQVAVVRRMVDDLSMPIEVVACPTVREHDGLARSSRNVYLSADERAAAPVLHRALRTAADAILGGERSRDRVETLMRDVVAAEPLAALDYAAAVDAHTLEPVDPLNGELRLLIAARIGPPRLLDNIGVDLRQVPNGAAE